MTRYLDRYYDPGLATGDETPEELAAGEITRLVEQYLILLSASQMPRRLSDATPHELALDKKRCRRLRYPLLRCLEGWGWESSVLVASDEIRQSGAKIDLTQWYLDHSVWLENRMRYVATWGKNLGYREQAQKFLTRLINEQNWLEYAMRD